MKIEDIILESSGKTVVGIHFSKKEGLKQLKASKHGEGLAGAERKRFKDYPESFLKDRVYFYSLDALKAGDVQREPGLGVVAYKASLKDIYDGASDPLGLKKKAKDKAIEEEGVAVPALVMNLFEQLVKSSGFSGYTMSGVVIVFDDVNHLEELGSVPANFRGSEKDSILG